MSLTNAETTSLLLAATQGDAAAADRLFPMVYEQLHELAERRMRHEHGSGTLQTTALVHEVYLRMVDQTRVDWKGKTHFFAVAANMMRRILVDHARARQRLKRGGGAARVALDEALAVTAGNDIEILALNEALDRLASLDPQQGKIVEMRIFGGMAIDQVAEVLGVSPRTVDGDMAMAKAWLKRELSKGEPAGGTAGRGTNSGATGGLPASARDGRTRTT